jgi:membrane-associated phospholipid phosphatase
MAKLEMKSSKVITNILILILLLIIPVNLLSQNIDIRILRSINSPQTLPSDKFFQFISNSNGYLVIGSPVGMGITGLIKHDNKLVETACVSLVSATVNSGITLLMKYTINRVRPFVTYPDITKKSAAGTPSFPSGHTSSAFAAATSLSLAYPKWYIIAPTFLWAGTVGYSRLDLGVHYPSDVLAGAIVGAGSAWLCFMVNQKLRSAAGQKKTPYSRNWNIPIKSFECNE